MITVVLTLTVGATVLRALRRATRRAAFEAPVTFDDALGEGVCAPCGRGGEAPHMTGVTYEGGP